MLDQPVAGLPRPDPARDLASPQGRASGAAAAGDAPQRPLTRRIAQAQGGVRPSRPPIGPQRSAAAGEGVRLRSPF